ncbi:MAG: hypothetical protein DRQ78_09075 [Epsilonproteobacteria bacterium]|nr:MAG: hypothetical protein DRQ78_09075 [Campylobacterota bacterium]
MFKLIKWVAITLIMPLLVIKEIYEVFKDAGIEIPDADDVLSEMKNRSPKATETKSNNDADYSQFMD